MNLSSLYILQIIKNFFKNIYDEQKHSTQKNIVTIDCFINNDKLKKLMIKTTILGLLVTIITTSAISASADAITSPPQQWKQGIYQ